MRLTDCFVDIIAYVTYTFQNTAGLPQGCDSLLTSINGLILNSETQFSKGGFDREDYELARFAVFVWIDETIMKSDWKDKTGWSRYLLQRRYYKTTDGGVEFYKKLDSLEQEKKEVREVYFLCLTLGYSGRFGLSGEDVSERENLKNLNLKRLTGTVDALSSLSREKIFPDAYPEGDMDGKPGKKLKKKWVFMSAVLGCGPVAVFLFLYALFRFVLNNEITIRLVH